MVAVPVVGDGTDATYDEYLTEWLCDPFTTYGEAVVLARARAVVAPAPSGKPTCPSRTARSGRPTPPPPTSGRGC